MTPAASNAVLATTFTITPTQAVGNIPQLNSVSFYVAPGTGLYTGWAVGNSVGVLGF